MKFTTPKGKAVYPHLKRPDVKFHDLGQYKADILVPIEEAKPLMQKLLNMWKMECGTAANKFDNFMFTVETDEDGEPTGQVLFKLRVKNKLRKDGEIWDRKPKLFDASLTPCPNANPFGGSTMAVSAEAYAWSTKDGRKGVSLQPLAVQIVNLVEGKDNADAGGFGFEATEGFVADNDAAAFTPAPTMDSDDDDDGDF